MGGVNATSRSTCEENMNEKWDEYAQAEITNYITVHTKGTESSGEPKMIVSAAESFHENGTEGMVKNTKKNAEP